MVVNGFSLLTVFPIILLLTLVSQERTAGQEGSVEIQCTQKFFVRQPGMLTIAKEPSDMLTAT